MCIIVIFCVSFLLPYPYLENIKKKKISDVCDKRKDLRQRDLMQLFDQRMSISIAAFRLQVRERERVDDGNRREENERGNKENIGIMQMIRLTTRVLFRSVAWRGCPVDFHLLLKMITKNNNIIIIVPYRQLFHTQKKSKLKCQQIEILKSSCLKFPPPLVAKYRKPTAVHYAGEIHIHKHVAKGGHMNVGGCASSKT